MSARRLRKVLRPILFALLGVVGVLGLIVGVVALYLNFKQDEIKQIVVGEVNKYLQAPVSVQAIDVSLFKDFPLVSVAFEGVQARPAPDAAGDDDTEDLLYAEQISLTFSLIDLAHKNYTVREIIIRGGDFNLKHYGKGRYNYEIWKKNDNPDRQALHFYLRRVLLRNTLIRWRDMVGKHDYQILARNVSARGDLNKGAQDFTLKGEVKLHAIQASGKLLLVDRKALIDLDFGNNREKKNFEIRKGHLSIEGLDFGITGFLHYVKSEAYLEYDIEGNKLKISQLVAMLPKDTRRSLLDYGFRGAAGFGLKIKGDYTTSFLNLYARFRYVDGTVTHKPSGITAQKVQVKGEYTNGREKRAGSSRLHFETIKASLAGGYIDGDFTLNNFDVPEISYKGRLEADLAELQAFFKFLPQTALEGRASAEVDFSNRFPNLRPKQWEKLDLSKAKINGYLSICDLGMTLKSGKKSDVDEKIDIDSIRVEFSPRAVKTNLFTLSYGGEQARVRLFAENVWSYCLLPQQNLFVSAVLKSPCLHMDKWQALAGAVSGAGSGSMGAGKADAQKASSKKLLNDLSASVQAEVDRVIYKNFVFNHINGTLHYSPEQIFLDGLSFGAFQGDFEGKAGMEKEGPVRHIWIEGQLNQMDITSCFHAFNDFGQKQITQKNLGGNLSADVRFKGVYEPLTHEWPLDRIALTADLNIRDGILQGLESLRKISRFTGENDLQNIHFKDLATTVEIHDECVYIQHMDVVSDAVNLGFEGTHTFGNEVNYLLNIELSDLLSRRRAQRVKKEEEDFGVEHRENGRIRLPLTVTGILPDVKVKYAAKEARKGAKERLQENRREFREALEEEFSDRREPEKKASGEPEGKPEGKPANKINETEGFKIEFEDE